MLRSIFLLSACLTASSLFAQGARLQLKLDHLAGKAEITEVTLPKGLIELACKFLDPRDPDTAKLSRLCRGLEGVYVRSFEFGSDNAYTENDVNAIRKQLDAPGWSCIIKVRKKAGAESADVCLFEKAGKVEGLAILSAEPKELTVVNILGAIDVEDIASLEFLGIPRIDIDKIDKKDLKRDAAKPPAKKMDEELN